MLSVINITHRMSDDSSAKERDHLQIFSFCRYKVGIENLYFLQVLRQC